MATSQGQNWATNHLILAAWGRASNSPCVVASGGGEVSASTVMGAAVTTCTDPMMVSGSRWRSSSYKLSARTARVPSVCTSCKTGLSPRRERVVGCNSTNAPAGRGEWSCTGSTRRDLPATLMVLGQERASASGP